jgi:hypothetical protein
VPLKIAPQWMRPLQLQTHHGRLRMPLVQFQHLFPLSRHLFLLLPRWRLKSMIQRLLLLTLMLK